MESVAQLFLFIYGCLILLVSLPVFLLLRTINHALPSTYKTSYIRLGILSLLLTGVSSYIISPDPSGGVLAVLAFVYIGSNIWSLVLLILVSAFRFFLKNQVHT